MHSPIAIALSGGVDSLVSAALLRDAGHEVAGFHFLTGFEIDSRQPATASSSISDSDPMVSPAVENIETMAAQLNIPLNIIDLSAEFQQHVVDYFTQSYQMGRTPNPCLVCNPAIKFGVLFKEAQKMGATAMATGHYARVLTGPDGRRCLLRGVDPIKDQSYFLARLSQAQLQTAILPLGTYTKDQTRRIAAEKRLRPSVSAESQDICFIKEGAYGSFLQHQPGFTSSHGPIQNLQDDVIGRHKGLHLFTIGQRRGINCPAAKPYYVVRIDAADNRLVVGFKEDLLTGHCHVGEINWIAQPPQSPLEIQARVRYRHTAVPARLIPDGESRARIEFDQAQTAVTPGQGAVFYQGDEVLGGGWIQ